MNIANIAVYIVLIFNVGDTHTHLDVDDDLSLELESKEVFMAAEASTLLPDFDQSRHSCCNQRPPGLDKTRAAAT